MFTSIKVWDAGVAAKAHPSPAGRHGQPNLSHSELYLCNNEYLQALEAIAKPQSPQKCHSERSEESSIFSDLRSFTSFRMTVKSDFAIASSVLQGFCYEAGIKVLFELRHAH
jgi:hypothetical protein